MYIRFRTERQRVFYVYIRFRTENLYVKILDFEVFMDALNRDISRL